MDRSVRLTRRTLTAAFRGGELGFAAWSLAVVPDHAVVPVEIEPEVAGAQNLWYALLFSRDLGFLAW